MPRVAVTQGIYFAHRWVRPLLREMATELVDGPEQGHSAVLPVGAQIVTRKAVQASNGRIAHPAEERLYTFAWLPWFTIILAGCLASCGCDFEPQADGRPASSSHSDSARPTHGFLGIMLVDPAATPLVIQGFVPGSPAATSGLRQEDILFRIDHQHNPTHDQLLSIVEQLGPGDSVGVQVTRGNKELEYRVELVSFDYIEQAMQQRSDSTE